MYLPAMCSGFVWECIYTVHGNMCLHSYSTVQQLTEEGIWRVSQPAGKIDWKIGQQGTTLTG